MCSTKSVSEYCLCIEHKRQKQSHNIFLNLFGQLLMREMDQALARQLLSLRHEIQDIRLRWSCEDHKTLVEDIRIELEELQYLGEITDVPVHLLEFHNPLKHWGVTKLNIHNKRFSTC